MRRGSERRLLVLARDQQIVFAELPRGRGGSTLQTHIEFDQPLDRLDARTAGTAMAAKLRDAGLSARHAMVTLPARSLVVKSKAMAPASGEVLAQMVRLATETAFTTPAQNLLIDFAPAATSTAVPAVMLIAASRARVEWLVQALDHADVAVQSVTPLLAAAARAEMGSTAVVHVSADGVELLLQRDGVPQSLTFAGKLESPADGKAIEPIAGAIRLAVAEHAMMGGVGSNAQVCIWDSLGLSDAARATLAQAAGIATDSTKFRVENWPAPGDALAPQLVQAALASSAAPTIDLLNSRLKVQPAKRFGKRARILSLTGAALLLGAAWLGIDLWQKHREIVELEAQKLAMADETLLARDLRIRMRELRGWYDDRPRHLGAMADISSAFPREGNVWATSLVLREDRTGVLTGRAENQRAVLGLLDSLKASGRFDNVAMAFIREADRRTQEIAFAMHFTFRDGG